MSNNQSPRRPSSGRPPVAGVVGGLAAVLAALAVVLIVERNTISTGLVLGIVFVMAAMLVAMGAMIGTRGRRR
ncbi:MAG: hypothetical protein ACTHOD_14565 [Motilibacteraceae bacterium]